MKTYLYPLFGLLLITGCATHGPDLATLVRSTEKSLARQNCISGARLAEFAKNTNNVDAAAIAEWVKARQDEQTNADPVLVAFDKMAVESDVTVKDENSLTLKSGSSWPAFGFGKTLSGQNDNKLNIATLNVAALSDMPDVLFNDKIAALEARKMDILKLLAAKDPAPAVADLEQKEFNAAATELDGLKTAQINLQQWIMDKIKAREKELAAIRPEAKAK
jgi:hypothetical protein